MALVRAYYSSYLITATVRSWKIASYKQVHKYTAENICYYEQYLKAAMFLPMARVKFADEVSFAKKGNQHILKTFLTVSDVRRRKAIGPIGKPVILNEASRLQERSLSAIVLTR